MGSVNEDFIGRFFENFLVLVRKRLVSRLDKIMVKSSVGSFWRANGHHGEVKVGDGVGGDRGGDWGLLPLII